MLGLGKINKHQIKIECEPSVGVGEKRILNWERDRDGKKVQDGKLIQYA